MAEPRSYVFEVPTQPLGANERRRAHWAVQYRDGKVFRDAVTLLARQAHRGPPLERARVDVTLVRRRGQVPLDPDNMVTRVKAPVDGLVVGGLLVDDAAAHIDLHVHQEQGSSRLIRLEITEIVDA